MIYDIRLQNFRSYKDDSFEFNPAVTIIVGANASGKTNLLEAILVMARGSSYRAKDVDLVRFDQPWARIDSRTSEGERIVKLTPSAQTKKEYIVGEQRFQRLALGRTIPVVLFEPNHLRLLAGSPDRRRVYLDELLTQTNPMYGSNLRRYKQTLAQRNALLKQNGAQVKSQMFPWNLKLSQLAGAIVGDRQAIVSRLGDSITDLYKTLSHTETEVLLTYESSCNLQQYESSLLHKLESTLAQDRERGFTSHGPHRDDLSVRFDGRPSALTASRGETRTAVLALKILELQLLERVREQKPLLLLDDVFSELDGARRHALTDYLSQYQTFITTTDADIALASFGEECTVIPLGA
ncbi:DNA replication/repair protein RecF [soil metagenome]